MSTTRHSTQLEFLREIDKLKGILRKTYLNDGSRHENSAEHSWHLALMAVVLQEHAAEPVDLSKVIRMLLVHDIVEIDAGDTFCYDAVGNRDKAEREQKAANRIFCLLPDDQSEEVRQLWDEFEERSTSEARCDLFVADGIPLDDYAAPLCRAADTPGPHQPAAR